MTNYIIETLDETATQGTFVFKPVEQRLGRPLGNALRRVLLSSVPGAAIHNLKIDGIYHEFTGIQGVVEDASAIILQLKKLILQMDIHDENVYTLRLEIDQPGEVYARDIQAPTGVKILNQDLYICTVAQGGSLSAVMQARLGRGYTSSEANKHIYAGEVQPLGMIYTDSLYSPVKNVAYDVQSIEVDGQQKESITISIETNGALKPSDALSIAGKNLRDHLDMLANVDENNMDQFEEEQEPVETLSENNNHKLIEDLNLSVRSYNCLKRAGIVTVEELTQKTEEEMSHVRNLGKKSLKEVMDKMALFGLSFRQPSE